MSKKNKKRKREELTEDIEDQTVNFPQSSPVVVLHSRNYHQFSKEEIETIRTNLLGWYDSHQRVLPWRKPSTPFVEHHQQGPDALASWKSRPYDAAYAVLVSEIMLQQTRVETVIAYFKRWMEAFPTLEDLANASLEEVNSQWSGLGYYRRAALLHKCAKHVLQVHDGKLPQSSDELVKLPGVGNYTAGAISSIAFNQVSPVVDGNVIRVLSRLRAIGADSKQSIVIKLFWQLASSLVSHSRPGDFNQGLMELGATVCTPRDPLCHQCPLSDHCNALKEVQKSEKNRTTKITKKNEDLPLPQEPCTLCTSPDLANSVTKFPVKSAKKPPRDQVTLVCILEKIHPKKKSRKFLMVQRPNHGLLAGFWEFPSLDINNNNNNNNNNNKKETKKKNISSREKEMLEEYINEELGILTKNISEDYFTRFFLGEKTHLFSHIKQTLYVQYISVKDIDFWKESKKQFGLVGDGKKNSGEKKSDEKKSGEKKPNEKKSESDDEKKSDKKISGEKKSDKKKSGEKKPAKKKRNGSLPSVRWISEEEMMEMAVSKGMKKCFELLKEHLHPQRSSTKKSPKKESGNQRSTKKSPKKESGKNLKIDVMFEKVTAKSAMEKKIEKSKDNQKSRTLKRDIEEKEQESSESECDSDMKPFLKESNMVKRKKQKL